MLASDLMIEVRPIKDSDRSALSNIYLRCRINTFPWMSKEGFKFSDFEDDTKDEKILVSTMDPKPVGFISIWMADHFIHHLFIDPNHQGQRLGEALLAEGLKIMGRPARLKCVVRNARACKFYEKHGWTIESTSQEGPMGPYRTYILVP